VPPLLLLLLFLFEPVPIDMSLMGLEEPHEAATRGPRP
jgi:hypothetical protein